MADWSIEQDEAGRGTIKHRAAPRFTAVWTSGEVDLSEITGLFWQDEGSGGEDSLTLYSFEWVDNPPDQAAFDDLMKQAVLAIDDWIVKLL